MGVFERFGKLPDDMQALVDVQIFAMLPQQEVESNCPSIMIKYQGRAEFGLLVVTNFHNAGMIYPLQDLKFSCRMPSEDLTRLFCCCGGEGVDPKPQWEFPRLCRGGSKSLTYPAVDTAAPSTKLRIASRQAHEEGFD